MYTIRRKWFSDDEMMCSLLERNLFMETENEVVKGWCNMFIMLSNGLFKTYLYTYSFIHSFLLDLSRICNNIFYLIIKSSKFNLWNTHSRFVVDIEWSEQTW